MKNAVFAVLVCAFSSIAAAQVTVGRAGRLVDPDSGTVLSDQVIVVDDGKIQAVGKGLAIPAGAKVIDLSDKTVSPGFIDCHTHLADGSLVVNGEPFDALMQAIQAATSNAADLLGLSSEIGSIKPGKYADLVAVNGNPLTNISVLENVEFVMKEGKVYKQAGITACPR